MNLKLSITGQALLALFLGAAAAGCGGGSTSSGSGQTGLQPGQTTPGGGVVQANQTVSYQDCSSTESIIDDFRFSQKHTSVPGGGGTEITVGTVLDWPLGSDPAFDAGRSGRENQLFHISDAFLQLATIVKNDCDFHLEISAGPSKTAPRIIVEMPADNAFQEKRRQMRDALAAHGFILSQTSGELATPLPVEVRGLAFRDRNHLRGSPHVDTPWELHPAVVELK